MRLSATSKKLLSLSHESSIVLALFLPAHTFLESVAFTVGVYDVAAMCNPVKQGGGQLLAAEDAIPFVEFKICCDDGGGALVPRADDLEKQSGAVLGVCSCGVVKTEFV